jgi:hypothetical protein
MHGGGCVVQPVCELHDAGHCGFVAHAPFAHATSQAHDAVQSTESQELGPVHVAVSAPAPETMRSHDVGPMQSISQIAAFMHQFVQEHDVSPVHCR